MNDNEKNRLIKTIQQVYEGRLDDLPKYIVDSTSEGLNILFSKLVETNFLKKKFQ
jgi:hypothetical protein